MITATFFEPYDGINHLGVVALNLNGVETSGIGVYFLCSLRSGVNPCYLGYNLLKSCK